MNIRNNKDAIKGRVEGKTHLLEERSGAVPCVIYILSGRDFGVVATERVEGKSRTHNAVTTAGHGYWDTWKNRNDCQHTMDIAIITDPKFY